MNIYLFLRINEYRREYNRAFASLELPSKCYIADIISSLIVSKTIERINHLNKELLTASCSLRMLTVKSSSAVSPLQPRLINRQNSRIF